MKRRVILVFLQRSKSKLSKMANGLIEKMRGGKSFLLLYIREVVQWQKSVLKRPKKIFLDLDFRKKERKVGFL